MAAKIANLYRSRHGVFYLRVCLTQGERQHTAKKEVWRSLRTKDAQTARGLALRFALEKNYAMPNSPAKSILDKITNPLSFTTKDGHTLDFDPDKPSEAAFAKAFIEQHTQAPTLTAEQRQAHAARDLERMRETEEEFQRLQARNVETRERIAKEAAAKASPPFAKYAHAYLTLIENSSLYARTKKAYAAKLKVFQEFIGKTATLADITQDKVLDFHTWLAEGDPLTKRKAITPRSIDEYSNVISNVYKTTIKKLAENPIEGRLVSKKQRMISNRKPFTPDELTRIFDPERLKTCRNPADFFFPILGLLTGSRPSSICQLRLGDIRREDGITVISYHDYLEGNSAKTSATNRIVPVHPILEQIGFLDYLEDVRQLEGSNATTLIFPWLNRYEQGFADESSQRFTAVLRHLKIYVHNVKVTYSLRHTTNQRMKERGVPEDFRCQYIGHENDSVNNITYGGITAPKFLLQQAIPHLAFEEINWSAIHYPAGGFEVLANLVEIAKRREARKEKRRLEMSADKPKKIKKSPLP
jgi:integrase